MKRILFLSFMLFISILGTKAAADDADGATIVKIAVSVKGKATYPTNQRCGYITANYGSGTSTIEVLASQNGETLEMKVPSGKAVSYRGEAYHGWDFEGVTVTDGIAKAHFIANNRSEYQYLAYTDYGTQYYRIPAIAKNYFQNKKNQSVEIIKLNGSVELAPIVGLADVIVDIVETGSTLRENGLTVLEEVCPLSARIVVNQVSLKLEHERIRKFLTDVNEALKAED